jgi:septal ring factor EnvC (AmiA/AmiB activator)
MLHIVRPVATLAAVLIAGWLPLGASAQAPDGARRTVPFEEARGTLPLPVAGRRIVAYGERTADGTPSSGLVIEAEPGAKVVSPCDGLVVYAGEFRSYGPLVIVSAGNGYHFMLAGLSSLDAQPGQRLRAGEPIGALGRTSPAGTAPRLDVRLLKDSRAIDPTPWWRKN